MDKSPELLRLQEGIDLDYKVNSYDQAQQDAYNQGHVEGFVEASRRFKEPIARLVDLTGLVLYYAPNINNAQIQGQIDKLAVEVAKLIDESANQDKLNNVILDAISCPICPLYNKNNPCVTPGSLQCRELKRKYFEGRGEVNK